MKYFVLEVYQCINYLFRNNIDEKSNENSYIEQCDYTDVDIIIKDVVNNLINKIKQEYEIKDDKVIIENNDDENKIIKEVVNNLVDTIVKENIQKNNNIHKETINIKPKKKEERTFKDEIVTYITRKFRIREKQFLYN